MAKNKLEHIRLVFFIFFVSTFSYTLPGRATDRGNEFENAAHNFTYYYYYTNSAAPGSYISCSLVNDFYGSATTNATATTETTGEDDARSLPSFVLYYSLYHNRNSNNRIISYGFCSVIRAVVGYLFLFLLFLFFFFLP